MEVGMPLLDADEKGVVIWKMKRTEIILRTSLDKDLDTGGSIWHAANKLSEYLVKNPQIVRNKKVLELGSGCGLVGLVAAALGAKSVTMSDIDSQVPIIEENVELNKYARTVKSKAAQDHFNSCEIKCVSIWFGEPIEEDFENQYDIILGADIGYDISLHAPLAQTIYTAIAHKRIYALLCEELRWNDIYTWYLEALVGKNLAIQDIDADEEASLHLQDKKDSSRDSHDIRSSPGTTKGTIYTMDYNEWSNSYDEAAAAEEMLSPASYNYLHLDSSSPLLSSGAKHLDAVMNPMTSPTVTKYPFALMEVSEDTGESEKVDARAENTKLLRELIRSIYAPLNSDYAAPSVEVALRKTVCPVKILKVNKKKFLALSSR